MSFIPPTGENKPEQPQQYSPNNPQPPEYQQPPQYSQPQKEQPQYMAYPMKWAAVPQRQKSCAIATLSVLTLLLVGSCLLLLFTGTIFGIALFGR